MVVRDEHERDNAGACSARLQTLIGTGSGAGDFAALLADARRLLGNDHETSLEIEYRLEARQDATRSATDSMAVWDGLRDRAAQALPANAGTAVAIRSHHLGQLRRCGRPADLDLIVSLCREEVARRAGAADPLWVGAARADLARVLRDRAWYADYGEPGVRYDPAGDLAEAAALIDEEVRRRSAVPAPDHVSTTTARRIQAEVLLARARDAPPGVRAGFGSLALRIAEDLVQLDDSEDDEPAPDTFDQLPRPHVLLAEALVAVGRAHDGRRVARLAYALQAGSRVFDPARPLLTLARSEVGDSPADALETGRAAWQQRAATFPPDSYYVAEAARLVQLLGGVVPV